MSRILVLLLMLAVQPPKAEKPMALDPVTQRRVYEAITSASLWATSASEELYPGKQRVKLPIRQQMAFVKAKKNARYNLMVGATNQVCEAYGISRDTLARVVSDPRSREQRFIPEPTGKSGLTMAGGERAFMVPTRFNPGLVILPEKIAKRIGYENPKPPRERKPLVVTPEMNVRARRPGEPKTSYEDSIRDQVERFVEIRERAKNTVIKDPVSQN